MPNPPLRQFLPGILLPSSGAASIGALLLSGSPYTAGTSTTNKPQLLLEDLGNTSTSWALAGTYLAVNAKTGFTGNLLDMQLNGVRLASLNAAGILALTTPLPATSGGTSLSSFGTNSILYANAPNSWSIRTPSSVSALVFTGATTDWGIVAPAAGGTGLSTYAQGDILYSAFTGSPSNLTRLPIGPTGYVLTVSGSLFPSWMPSSSGATPFTTKSFNAMNSPPSGAYVSFGNNLNFEYTTPFSFTAWVNPTTAAYTILGKWTSGQVGYILYRDTGDNTLTFNMGSVPFTSYLRVKTPASSVLSNGSFYHVAVTTDGTGTAAGVKLYINGVSQTLTTVYNTLTTSILNSQSFLVGGDTSFNDGFDGLINNVGAYNRVLTPSEVTAVYNTGKSIDLTTLPSNTALTNWWRLGNGDSATASSGFLDSKGSLPGTGSGSFVVTGSITEASEDTGFINGLNGPSVSGTLSAGLVQSSGFRLSDQATFTGLGSYFYVGGGGPGSGFPRLLFYAPTSTGSISGSWEDNTVNTDWIGAAPGDGNNTFPFKGMAASTFVVSGTQTSLTRLGIDGTVVFKEISTPGTNPPSGYQALYIDSTAHALYLINSSGVPVPVNAGSIPSDWTTINPNQLTSATYFKFVNTNVVAPTFADGAYFQTGDSIGANGSGGTFDILLGASKGSSGTFVVPPNTSNADGRFRIFSNDGAGAELFEVSPGGVIIFSGIGLTVTGPLFANNLHLTSGDFNVATHLADAGAAGANAYIIGGSGNGATYYPFRSGAFQNVVITGTDGGLAVTSGSQTKGTLLMKEISTPVANPPSGYQALYIDSTAHALYMINSSGTPTPVGGGTGTGNFLFVGNTISNSSVSDSNFNLTGQTASLNFTTAAGSPINSGGFNFTIGYGGPSGNDGTFVVNRSDGLPIFDAGTLNGIVARRVFTAIGGITVGSIGSGRTISDSAGATLWFASPTHVVANASISEFNYNTDWVGAGGGIMRPFLGGGFQSLALGYAGGETTPTLTSGTIRAKDIAGGLGTTITIQSGSSTSGIFNGGDVVVNVGTTHDATIAIPGKFIVNTGGDAYATSQLQYISGALSVTYGGLSAVLSPTNLTLQGGGQPTITSNGGINLYLASTGTATVQMGFNFSFSGYGTNDIGSYGPASSIQPFNNAYLNAIGLGYVAGDTPIVAAAGTIKVKTGTPLTLLADSTIVTNGSASEQTYPSTASTTDATVTTIKVITLQADTTALVTVKIVGRRTGGSAGATDDSAVLIRTAACKNVGGTVTAYGLFDDFTFRDQASWEAVIVGSGTNVLVQVNGATNNNVSWSAITKVVVQ